MALSKRHSADCSSEHALAQAPAQDRPGHGRVDPCRDELAEQDLGRDGRSSEPRDLQEIDTADPAHRGLVGEENGPIGYDPGVDVQPRGADAATKPNPRGQALWFLGSLIQIQLREEFQVADPGMRDEVAIEPAWRPPRHRFRPR